MSWARIDPFLPSSPQQVLDYVEWRGYKTPLHRKTRKKTVNEEALTRLLSSHPEDPLLRKVLEARALLKARGFLESTYVGRDGRFHPIYTFHPATGRLSARSPNIMQQPAGRKDAKAELAEAVRSTIVASPGMLLVEADWKAIEAVLVGFFADDPDYIRLAKLGVHAYLASHILKKPVSLTLPDEELLKAFNRIKKESPEVYAGAKKTVHARSYGEGAGSIAKDLGCTWSEAMQYIRIYEGIAPKVKAWQNATRLRAHKERKLVNPFSYVSPYFFEVLKKDGTLGRQANEVLAFLPQSTGASLLRETLLRLAPSDPGTLRLLAPIHDSVLCEVREGALDRAVQVLRGEMTREWEELGGLSFGVEVKVGKSWAKMEEYCG